MSPHPKDTQGTSLSHLGVCWRVVSTQQHPPSPAFASGFALVFLVVQGASWRWLCSQELEVFTGGLNPQQESRPPATSERIGRDAVKGVGSCLLLLYSRLIFLKKKQKHGSSPPPSLCFPTTHLVLNTFFRPDFVQTQCCSASIKRQFSTQRIKSSC